MQENKIKVACFGELLWDIFPNNKRRIGGAPFNVAYHLFKMGMDATMLSAIGRDDLGAEVLDKLNAWKMTTKGLQIHESYPTSTVIAHMDENNDAHYDIVENVAWDFIEKTVANQNIVDRADALVFGTLSTRNQVSRDTLFDLLELSKYNVFDINLRDPFYDVNTIKDLLYKTDLAKFNKAELRMMLDFMGKAYSSEKDSIRYLQDTFNLQEVIISKGSKGALYARGDNFYLYPTVPVVIKDTVGSGDSFLAGFLSKRLEQGTTAEQTMQHAVTLGAFITAKEGACPEYTLNEFLDFRDQHKVTALDFTDI
ncbi:carbohydrate kinase family protein [Sphingobacterium deserti]|uniref:Ribokinase-like domain-containing protein n=1 Tax=Sphingobacterium deserti TaxID=1229276 RepID=A0A0B8T4R1_9SPHI|nr:carbohydrate kinase [Sphingobacterium deserti]KGE15118.1 ribokinase-like domain-containing protein [Sphingobacterium deserti]